MISLVCVCVVWLYLESDSMVYSCDLWREESYINLFIFSWFHIDFDSSVYSCDFIFIFWQLV